MGLHNWLRVFFYILIEIFVIILFGESIRAEESKYEACRPRSCSGSGGVDISYPFYIFDAGADYCGHPGFVIGCEDGKPIYRVSTGGFLIESISYENQTIHLVNLEVITPACFAPLNNFSFDRSSLDFSPYHADLLFFYNCTGSSPVNDTKTRIRCASGAMNNSYVALVHWDQDWDLNSIACDRYVGSPVQLEREDNQTIRSVDYIKLLNHGFTLHWTTGYDCARCQRSGGHCGFDDGSSVCFCPDGPHSAQCNNGKATPNLICFA